MRIILFFDLPTETSAQQKAYRRFHKKLIENGFLMEQYSVYSKLALNKTVANTIINKIKDITPKEGVVQVMTITEKQYSEIEYIIGEKKDNVINSTDRLIII